MNTDLRQSSVAPGKRTPLAWGDPPMAAFTNTKHKSNGMNNETWQCQARDKQGRVFTSTHSTKQEAQESAKCCRGRYPYGNRVKVVQITGSDTAAK